VATFLVEKRTNSLIVSDLASNLDAVEKMALALDSTTPQIEITAKLVDVDAEALREIGVEWNVAPAEAGVLGADRTATGTALPTRFPAAARSTTSQRSP
jgi:protein transport protein HofQ